MLLLQVLLLASFQVITVLAQLGSSVCFGTGSICDAALNVTCPSDINNATVLLACYCPTKLPLQQACDECAYEFGVYSTVDNYFWTSQCNEKSIPIGTVPQSILRVVADHTATIAVSKSRTFDSASMLSSYSVRQTRTTPIPTTGLGSLGRSRFTSTLGGATAAYTVIPSAPPSVPDMGTNPQRSGEGRNTLSAGLIILGVTASVCMVWQGMVLGA